MGIFSIPTFQVDEMPEDWGRFLIHGPQGYGKTMLAATIAEVGKTLFIDLTGEHGVRSFRGAPYAKNIDIIRPPSITDMDDVYWELAKGDHDYQAVVVDSLTAVQKMTMRYLLGHDETAVREIKQGVAPADRKTWGQSLDVMVDTATFWYGLADGNNPHPMHVVMTAQTKIREDDDGNTSRQPDVQAGALSITLATPDYILYTDVEPDLDNVSDDGSIGQRYIVRFGANPEYRTKARLPHRLQGRMPSVLGRKNQTKLVTLGRVLGIGGMPSRTTRPSQPALPTPLPATTEAAVPA